MVFQCCNLHVEKLSHVKEIRQKYGDDERDEEEERTKSKGEKSTRVSRDGLNRKVWAAVEVLALINHYIHL